MYNFMVQDWFQLLGCRTQSFQEDDKKEFRKIQNLTKGEVDFNQFMQLRSQLVTAAEKYPREENFSPVLIPRLSKNMDEQLTLAHKRLT